jgi:hypothetical protein
VNEIITSEEDRSRTGFHEIGESPEDLTLIMVLAGDRLREGMELDVRIELHTGPQQGADRVLPAVEADGQKDSHDLP